MKTNKTLARIAWIVCLATGIVISVKQIREPDIWWMLKTGEWICKNHRVPMMDMFSYTFDGTPWINVKWCFEILLYGISLMGGPEFTPVLQCIISVSILLILFNTFSFIKNVVLKTPVNYPTYGIIISSFLFLFVNEFRLNGRPEMTSHLMTALYLNILLKARFKNPKLIYWIIPLQVIWTNFHEAYGTGMVIMLVSAFAVWIENYFFKKNKTGIECSPEVRKTFSITALLTLLAPALHPQGFKMIYHPVEIFKQVSENKFTTELASFTDADYWHYQAYISTGLFLMVMIYFFSSNYKSTKKKFLSTIFQSCTVFGLFYFILFILFFYLSLTAFRNIPFFVIVSTPVIAVAIEKFFSGIKKFSLSSKFIYVFLIVLGVFSYCFIVTNHYYKIFNPRDAFGMKIDSDKNPVGAAKFLKDHHITGTGFNDYLTSSYLLWSLYPDFKTFIDLRDLDIFPESFFKSYALISNVPEYFDSSDAKVHYEYAVVYRLQFQPLHQHLVESSNWDLVYADAVTAVYLKKNDRNKKLIDQFGFHQNYKDVFVIPGKPKSSAAATFFCKTLWYSYDPSHYDNVDYDLIASQFYLMIHQYNFALSHAQKSSSNHTDDSQGFAMLGNIYFNISISDSTDSLKSFHLAQAENYFNDALQKNKNSAASFYGLGVINIMTNNIGTAKTCLRKCVMIDPSMKDAYLKLAECETIISKQYPASAKKNLEQWIEYMEKAVDLDKENVEMNYRLGMGYCTNGDKSKAKKYLRKAIESNQLDAESIKAAENCLGVGN